MTAEQPGEPSPLMTRGEVAELLQVSTKTVDRMRREGELDDIRLGRLIRFQRDKVLALLNRNGATLLLGSLRVW